MGFFDSYAMPFQYGPSNNFGNFGGMYPGNPAFNQDQTNSNNSQTKTAQNNQGTYLDAINRRMNSLKQSQYNQQQQDEYNQYTNYRKSIGF